MTQAKEVKCPQCGRLTFYSPENPYRPFCSERCKLIDLGEWASGNYAIPINKESEAYQEAEDESDDSEGAESPN